MGRSARACLTAALALAVGTGLLPGPLAAAAMQARAAEHAASAALSTALVEPRAMANVTAAVSVIQLGQVAPAQLAPPSGNGCTDCTLFQGTTASSSPSYRAPADGTITSWSVQGPSDGCSGCTVRLRIFRQTATGTFLTVADSADQAVAPGLNTFSVTIAVRAGDILGIRATNGIRWYGGIANDQIDFVTGDPVPGALTTPLGSCTTAACWFNDPNGNGARVNVAATLQPAGITGTARCRSGETSYTLGAAILKSGDTVIATRTELVNGAFTFNGTAPRTTYGLDYVGSVTIGDVTSRIQCSVTVTTDAYGGAVAPAGSIVPDLGNHTFLTALPLTNGVGQADFMAVPGRPNWYKIAIGPGQRLSVTVAGPGGGALPADLVLTLFGDIPARQAADRAALASNSDPLAALRRNDAGVAPDGLSPDGLSPDGLSPDGLSPDGLSPDGLSPDGLSPDGLSPDGLSPDGLSPDGLSPDGLSPDGLSPDGLSSLYTAAQTESLLRVSDKPGTQPEAVAQNTWSATGSYYIRVRGHNGAFSAAQPYAVTATLVSTSCGNVTLTSTFSATTTATAGAYRTIVLTNTARLGPNAGPLTATDAVAFRQTLATFAARPEIGGVVVDLATSGPGGAPDAGAAAAYTQWWASTDARTCPAAANIVASTIKQVVDAYGTLNPTLHYVVIAGGDAVIPYLRVPDQAGLGNESGYQPPVDPTTASDASLRFGYVLTDGFYGSTTPIARYDHQLYLMDRPTGRLVESPADIGAMLAAYAAGFDPRTGDVIQPTSALVTGYDFLTDTAQFIAGQWSASAGGFAVDQDLISSSWTAGQLAAKLLGPVAPSYGIVSLNGHFSANTMLAADFATRLRTTDFAAITDQRFRNLLILSSGCHSGYNIVDDQGIPNVTQPLDWPQLFNGRGATLIGGTGYQYGDTDFRKYTELILSNLSQELRYGSGPVAIGEALARAKATYLGQVATLSGTDEKALNESTLYGLPMFTVELPAAVRLPRPGTAGGISTTAGNASGLAFASIAPSYTLTRRDTLLSSPIGPQLASYYDASYGTGPDVQTTPGSQILPRVVLDVHADATRTARGVVLDHATFTNHGGFIALTDAAAIEGSGSRAYFTTPVATPVIPFTLNTFVGEHLILTPAQFRSSTPGSPAGVERTLDTQTLRVYYSSRTDAAALAAAPIIYRVGVTADPTNAARVLVDVTIGGSIDPGVETVLATYSADPDAPSGAWASVDLAAGGDTSNDGLHFVRHYTGAVPAAAGAAAVRLFIQAVGGNALVSRATNNGAYYGIPTAPPPTLATPLATSSLTLAAPASVAYRSSFSASATVTGVDGAGLAGKAVSFTLDGPAPVSAVATTDATGRATATLRANAVPGTYRVAASFSGDGAFLGATDERSITITRAPTTLASAGSPSIVYSESGVIAALRAGAHPLPLVPVSIAEGGLTIGGSTDAGGRVRLDTMDLSTPGTATYQVSFAGDDRYLPSAAQVAVTLAPAAATVVGRTLAPQPVGAVVSFPAVVTETPDGTPGDLTRAQVRTELVNEAGTVVDAATTAVQRDGSTSATFTLAVAGVYQVNTTVVGGYYTSPTTSTLLGVYDPARFVTGGGWAAVPAAGGLVAEKKAELTIDAKYLAGRVTPTGSVELRAPASGLTFRATTFDWLVISGGRAELQGTGTLDRSTAIWRFRLVVVDGAPDTFGLSIWDASGPLAAPRYRVGPVALQGGQMTIH